MKNTLITLSLLVSFSTLAEDMSRTERWQDAQRELPDGSSEYIGGCSVHQDYEGKMFSVTKTIVKGYEPSWKTPEDTMKKLKHVEKELLEAAAEGTDGNLSDFFNGVDDFTLEKISHKKIKGLDLYRWNIGVGGGNGYYQVFNRIMVKGKPTYEMLSHVFDGDLEHCDSLVWIKK